MSISPTWIHNSRIDPFALSNLRPVRVIGAAGHAVPADLVGDAGGVHIKGPGDLGPGTVLAEKDLG